ncbi:hypothetical protein [Streptomyces coeruleorubidus]
MHSFETGQTVVRRDVYRRGRVWSEHALRVVADTSEARLGGCLSAGSRDPMARLVRQGPFGIVTDTEHQAVAAARDQVLAMLEERSGPFANASSWSAWRWNPAWPIPSLPRPALAGQRVAPTGG